jgi:hypothetical protein
MGSVNGMAPQVWEHLGARPTATKGETVDENRIPVAGDPFYAASRRTDRDQKAPHGCYDGVVYIGHMVEGEDGEEVEVYEAVPCRRCANSR